MTKRSLPHQNHKPSRIATSPSRSLQGDHHLSDSSRMGTHRKRPRITGKHEAISEPNVHIDTDPGSQSADDAPCQDVTIIITQAFGPKGDNLVGISDVTFGGYSAVTLGIRANDQEGHVHLSPIHGDDRKTCTIDIPEGTECELFCPISMQSLDRIDDLEKGNNFKYFAIYLTPKCSPGSMVAISAEWGHYHSRIIDHYELISSWEGND